MQYLSAQLMEVPALREALEQVALAHPAPRGNVYIARPGILDYEIGDRPFYQIGAKLTYFDKAGVQDQLGYFLRIAGLQHQTLLERSVYILALQLADGLLEHEDAKKPLAIQPLTTKDREEMRLPF